MQSFLKFSTSSNQVFYATSQATFAKWWDGVAGANENAKFDGREQISKRRLCKVARGVYLRNDAQDRIF